MNKKNVFFIGSFKPSGKDGTVGGQMFACKSLVSSKLKEDINWILLDTTASTNLERSFYKRLYKGIYRVFKSIYIILFKDIDTVIAFCSSGYSFMEKGLIIKMAHFFGKKTILAPRSGHLISNIENDKKFRKRAKKIFDSCDYLICQGSFWMSYFSKEFSLPKDKLIKISNWIDINAYQIKTKEIRTPIKILFLGWIEKNKGIWDLLKVVKSLRDENFIIDFAGNGKEYDDFQAAVKSEQLENKIILHGWVHGKAKFNLLKNSDIFILPSYKEGLPNALLEAMASKTAIIASKAGAIPDIIEHNENGYLIDAGNTDLLAHYLKKYLSNKELILKHAENALKTVKEKNSLSAVIPKFKKIL